jgi:hypothetical protein
MTAHLSGAPLLVLLCLVACGDTITDSARTPSDSFALTGKQIEDLTSAADRGDVAAMNRLSLYYGVNRQDVGMQLRWLERAADSGDADAREFLLEHYGNSRSEKERQHGDMLRKRWATN